MGKYVTEFIKHGPLFSADDDSITEEQVYFYQNLLENILAEELPVTVEEAKLLMLQFNHNDSSFGLAWMLLEAIESADWDIPEYSAYIQSVKDSLDDETEWIDFLEIRQRNSMKDDD